MKKIISFIIFTAALIWTWNVIHSSNEISIETHAGIQSQLEVMIQQALTKNKPNITDFKIQKLWTETINKNKIKAVFSYSFAESSNESARTEETIDGEAILHRQATENNTEESWKVQSVKTNTGKILFSEELVVTPEEPEK